MNTETCTVTDALPRDGESRRAFAEIARLVQTTTRGELGVRGDTAGFSARDAELLGIVNDVLDATVKPLPVASNAMIAGQILTARVTGDYQGDHAIVKNNISTMAGNLERAMSAIRRDAPRPRWRGEGRSRVPRPGPRPG
jgi:hypothetical protein